MSRNLTLTVRALTGASRRRLHIALALVSGQRRFTVWLREVCRAGQRWRSQHARRSLHRRRQPDDSHHSRI